MRLPMPEDKQWAADRTTILQALGVLDPEGKPTKRLDVVKGAKVAKLTQEDWRNRAKWDAYQTAARDMIEKTSCDSAPWVLVEADNKEWARISVLRAVVRRLKKEFE